MPEVDYERAWLALKAVVNAKKSHGRTDLFVVMAELEVDCSIPDGQQAFDPRPPARLHQARSAS